MKKFLKILGLLVIVVVLILAIAVIYINSAMPNVELRNEFKVQTTPELIKRGDYLANNVNACFHCHTKIDFSKFSGKIDESVRGAGGRYYSEKDGFPGTFYASNITPYALASWSDAELYRAITSGVSKDGRVLFPLMPYHEYRYLSDIDAKALIAYLRTIKPIAAEYSKSKFSFPFSMIMKMIPTDPEPTVDVDTNNSVKYGSYLARIAGCQSCHTPSDGGTPIEGMDFAGGFEIPMETGGVCRTANITPDKETGIGSWSKERFIDRFTFYKNIDSLNVKPGEYNSEMPWSVYAGMSEEDLGAIYDFLMTVRPVKNYVTKFTP